MITLSFTSNWPVPLNCSVPSSPLQYTLNLEFFFPPGLIWIGRDRINRILVSTAGTYLTSAVRVLSHAIKRETQFLEVPVFSLDLIIGIG